MSDSYGLGEKEYAVMFEAEESYFWFAAKRRLILEIVSRETLSDSNAAILDVGCGTGKTAAELSEKYRVVVLDPSEAALGFCRRRGLSALVKSRAEILPFADNSYRAVVASDLIEHLDDDAACIAEIKRVLLPGGTAVLTVPAIPFLFGSHDVALGHKRRYSKKRLAKLLEGAGFGDAKIFSYMSAVTPAVVPIRLLRKAFRLPSEPEKQSYAISKVLNGLFSKILDAEKKLVLSGIDFKIGTSLVAIAKK